MQLIFSPHDRTSSDAESEDRGRSLDENYLGGKEIRSRVNFRLRRWCEVVETVLASFPRAKGSMQPRLNKGQRAGEHSTWKSKNVVAEDRPAQINELQRGFVKLSSASQ